MEVGREDKARKQTIAMECVLNRQLRCTAISRNVFDTFAHSVTARRAVVPKAVLARYAADMLRSPEVQAEQVMNACCSPRPRLNDELSRIAWSTCLRTIFSILSNEVICVMVACQHNVLVSFQKSSELTASSVGANLGILLKAITVPYL